jgi:hypothetical protein
MEEGDGFVLLKHGAGLFYEHNRVLSAQFCREETEDLNSTLVSDRITLIDEEGGFYGRLPTKKIVQDLRDFADWLERGPE